MACLLDDVGLALHIIVLCIFLGLHEGELLLGDPLGLDGAFILLLVLI